MEFEDIFKQVDPIKGWMGRPDCLALYEYVKEVKGLIVEIGSYMGRSAKLMALSSPECRIVSIDSYPKIYDHKALLARDECIKTMDGENWELIQKKSRDVEWKEPIDFLHIDGDHSYKAVKQDIELFAPHVKKGHYIFLHDYVVTNYGVKRAVEDSKKYFDEVKIVSGFACCRV